MASAVDQVDLTAPALITIAFAKLRNRHQVLEKHSARMRSHSFVVALAYSKLFNSDFVN